MSTKILGPEQESESPRAERRTRTGRGIAHLLAPLASLKLTVALMSMAIFLIFAGTLAQVDKDIWEVMGLYFRTFVARIDLQVFFPPSFFPSRPVVPGFIWFPGGFAIGTAMFINLVAAHGLRFKIQSRGAQLTGGLMVILAGALLTLLVIVGGSDKETIEGAGPASWSGLWLAIKLALLVGFVAAAYGLYRLEPGRSIKRWLLGALTVGLGVLATWLWYQGDNAALSGPAMRILWQLAKAGGAALVLLAGCALVFRRRAGIVLLHAGVGLMMVNELVVYSLHSEGQMQIREGETVNYLQDVRALEVAVVDPSPTHHDRVVVVPKSRLIADKTVSDGELPFRLRLVDFLQNAELKPAENAARNRATAGAGMKWVAEPARASTGTDTSGNVDLSAAYVKLLDKDGGRELGTYLLSLELLPQKVAVDGKTYDVALRFKRSYRPYSMHLYDVRFDKYVGTNTPRNYSSEVQLVDSTRHVDRRVKIWMNNPLRFAGETFYQSEFKVDPAGNELTNLQVVKNTGWMIPYVACVIVALGLLSHFMITLLRFLERADEKARSEAGISPAARRSRRQPAGTGGAWSSLVFPAAVVGILGLWVASKTMPERVDEGKPRLDEFGRLPLVYEGRVKPFDTLARNTLRMLSDKQALQEEFIGDSKKLETRTEPAIKWLLDVISGSPEAGRHKVFRIENLDVLQTLGLKPRSGFRYSLDEFRSQITEFENQSKLAGSVPPDQLSVYQKKVLELERKLRLWQVLDMSFSRPTIRLDAEHAKADLMETIQAQQMLAKLQPPLAVPPASKSDAWEPYTTAWTKAFAKLNFLGEKPSRSVVDFDSMLVAYRKGDAQAFNSALASYQAELSQMAPADYIPQRIRFEAFFNHFEPFYHAAVLYLIAFVLECLSWLGWTRPLRRASFWLLMLALAVHTVALVSRIYISQRPPVVNLYSSAVFIGWGCVVLGLVFESIYRMGVGNVVASVAGFATLLIAHFLAASGDTFIVLQAVLDTQFWLATHVTCVTLGYATTYMAGLLGMFYILRGTLTPSLSPEVGKELARMIYGTLCFAIFFSFVGTVLGGLWADDSWGRFWGWDPKENGALIIVLWNAVVLHARWGGMVRHRGLAMLAVVGNIVTSWSWFGVNELGVGLHAYGFTEGVLKALGIFILTQLATIALGLLPPGKWWSARRLQTV